MKPFPLILLCLPAIIAMILWSWWKVIIILLACGVLFGLMTMYDIMKEESDVREDHS